MEGIRGAVVWNLGRERWEPYPHPERAVSVGILADRCIVTPRELQSLVLARMALAECTTDLPQVGREPEYRGHRHRLVHHEHVPTHFRYTGHEMLFTQVDPELARYRTCIRSPSGV